MKSFPTYAEARRYAEAQGKASLLDGWTVKMLPRPENRYGWELRC